MAPKFIPAIASQSLGCAQYHRFENKIAACARHGYKAIELFYEDLKRVAQSPLPQTYRAAAAGASFTDSTEWEEKLLVTADYVHQLLLQNDLDLICLQPFMHYDGLVDRSEHEFRIRELHFWFLLADRLHTDLIQIPSNFLPVDRCTDDREQIADDLREVADLGLQHSPPIRFAYEALCWGTHIDHWDQAWDIVKRVDRPNFGACLDTFNIAGRVYGDPTAESGKTPNAEADIQRSMEILKKEIDLSKVFYVELVDAERMDRPLRDDHEWHVSTQKPRMSWSRNARLFPFEEKGYLPVLDILKVICDLGYEGYLSFEMFSRTLNAPKSSVPEDHARRGQVSWNKVVQYMGWSPEEEMHQLPEEVVSSPAVSEQKTFTSSSKLSSQPIFQSEFLQAAAPSSQQTTFAKL